MSKHRSTTSKKKLSASKERQTRWEKSNKEWGPKNGEIVRDKFPQAFKEYVLNRKQVSKPNTNPSKDD